MKRKYLSLAAMLLAFSYSSAQTSPESDSLLFDMGNISAFEEASGLQKSLNSEFQASAISGISSREVPNIVSFVTAKDIQNTGARDLIDVLRLIPGFDFGVDVETAVGPALRGNWGMEGKILLLIDGIEMNELNFQNLFFSHHFPVDIIERIEVIRGPGSATYGGTAEYGVINIITKGKSGLEGINLYTTYSHLGETYGRRQAGIAVKKSLSKAVIDLTASLGEGNRSDDTFISFSQDTFDLAKTKTAYVQPSYLNIGLKSGNFQVRALYDNYTWHNAKYEIENKQISTYASYEIKLDANTTLIPKISYTNQLPWHYVRPLDINDEESDFEYRIRAQRLAGNLTLNKRFTRRISLISGLETQYQSARDLLFVEGNGGNFGDAPTMSFMSYSIFSQLFWKTYFANLTGGLRYEYRNGFGGALVPRLAATKHLNKWHMKLLYSHAYRMPGFENINLAVGVLKPEISKVAEAEIGYQFTPDMMLALNVFRTGVKDIIVYGFDAVTSEESYVNQKLAGSKGLEANFQIQKTRWRSQLTYSFYKPLKRNTVEDYQIEGRPDLYLGLAAHKISFNGTVDLTKKLHLNTTAIWNSERYGYTRFSDDEESYVLERFDPYLLLNLFARYENILPNLHLGAGVYNLFDVQFGYLQPYAGESAPMPNPGKEWVVKLQYELPFKK